jgi:ElaB/YqjD/DUF883 family membrane-anchored ribosome-binding protein
MTDTTTTPTTEEQGDLARLARKVEKLLALSQSANENEAAAAAAKVQELLQTYNLEIADIEALRGEKKERHQVFMVRVPFVGANGKGWNQRTPWEISLSATVAHNFFCKTLSTSVDVLFIGTEANLQTATYVYAQLAVRLWALSAERRNTYVRDTKTYYKDRGITINPNYQTNKMGQYDPYCLSGSEHPNAWRRSWLEGAVAGVASKLAEQRRAFEKATEGKGTALALNHDERNQQFIDDVIKPSGEYKPRDRATNRRAQQDGFEAGYNMNIHAGLGGSADAPAIGEVKRIRGGE